MAGGIIGSILGGVLTGGAGPAIGAGIGAAIPSVAEIARTITERLIPDPAKRAEAEAAIAAALANRDAAMLQAVTSSDAAQNAINLAEAQGNDRYSSRWRPSIGWIGALALGYQFLFAPFATWLGGLLGTMFGFTFPVPPMLPTGDLMPLIYALLGLTASRTVERINGVSTTAPAQPGHR